jgi:hypothetical protein
MKENGDGRSNRRLLCWRRKEMKGDLPEQLIEHAGEGRRR